MQKIIRKRDKKTFFSFLRLLLYVKKTTSLFFLPRTDLFPHERNICQFEKEKRYCKQANQLRLHQLKALTHRRL